jgi:hypothetical protein
MSQQRQRLLLARTHKFDPKFALLLLHAASMRNQHKLSVKEAI